MIKNTNYSVFINGRPGDGKTYTALEIKKFKEE